MFICKKKCMKYMETISTPSWFLPIGITEITIIFLIYNLTGYGNSSFFRFGPPIVFLQTPVNDYLSFTWIILTFFIHQLVYCFLYDIIQPWVFNEIQNEYCYDLRYSKIKTIILVNMYYTYIIVNNVFMVSAVTVQFSFVLITIVAQWIASTFINYNFLIRKEGTEETETPSATPDDNTELV